MLNIFGYYKNNFLYILKSQNTPEWSWGFNVEQHNELKEQDRQKNLENNKILILNYLENLNREKDDKLSYKTDDWKWDIEKGFIRNNSEEKFIENLLSDLKLDQYSLEKGINLAELTNKIKEFTVLKSVILTNSIQNRTDLMGVAEAPFQLLWRLLDKEHNWVFKNIFSKEKNNNWALPNDAIIDLLKKEGCNDLVAKIKGLLWDTFDFWDWEKFSFTWDGKQILDNFNKLSPKKQDQLSEKFTDKLVTIQTSWIGIINYFTWKQWNSLLQEWKSLDSQVIDSLSQKIKTFALLKEVILTSLNQTSWTNKWQLEMVKHEIENLTKEQEEKLDIQLKWINTNTLFVWQKIQSWWVSFDLKAFWRGINIWLWIDKNWIPNWWIWTNFTLFDWRSDDWKTNWAVTASLNSWWASLSAWVWREVIEWTTNYADAIDDNWIINLSKIKSKISWNASIWWWVSWESPIPTWSAWLTVWRDHISPIQSVASSFEQSLHQIDWINKWVKVLDIPNKINLIKDLKIKSFISNLYNENSAIFSNKDTIVNLRDFVIHWFASKLANSAKEHLWWTVSSIWVWIAMIWWMTIPTILWWITTYNTKYDYKNNQSVYRNSEQTENITDANQMLSSLKIINLVWGIDKKWYLKIKPALPNEKVSDKINISIPKGANLSDLIWYNKSNWEIQTVSSQLLLKTTYETLDENKSNATFSLVIWDDTKQASDFRKITQTDLESLSDTSPKAEWLKTVEKPVTYDTNESIKKHNKIIDDLIIKNLDSLWYLRTENEPLTRSFYEDFSNDRFDEARVKLIEILNQRPDLKGVSDELNSPELKSGSPELKIALAQVKNAMMIDSETISAVKDQYWEKWKWDFTKVLENRQNTKWWLTAFERVFSGKIDTTKYSTYFNQIIKNLPKDGVITKSSKETEMFWIIATYPRSKKNESKVITKGIDVIPPWIAEVLGWPDCKVELDNDDIVNKSLIADKIANSSYWKTILDLINRNLVDKPKIKEDDLKYLIVNWWQGWNIKIETKFYAFLNWFSANESLWMELQSITINNQVVDFKMLRWIWVTQAGVDTSTYWHAATFVPEQKQQQKEKEEKTKEEETEEWEWKLKKDGDKENTVNKKPWKTETEKVWDIEENKTPPEEVKITKQTDTKEATVKLTETEKKVTLTKTPDQRETVEITKKPGEIEKAVIEKREEDVTIPPDHGSGWLDGNQWGTPLWDDTDTWILLDDDDWLPQTTPPENQDPITRTETTYYVDSEEFKTETEAKKYLRGQWFTEENGEWVKKSPDTFTDWQNTYSMEELEAKYPAIDPSKITTNPTEFTISFKDWGYYENWKPITIDNLRDKYPDLDIDKITPWQDYHHTTWIDSKYYVTGMDWKVNIFSNIIEAKKAYWAEIGNLQNWQTQSRQIQLTSFLDANWNKLTPEQVKQFTGKDPNQLSNWINTIITQEWKTSYQTTIYGETYEAPTIDWLIWKLPEGVKINNGSLYVEKTWPDSYSLNWEPISATKLGEMWIDPEKLKDWSNTFNTPSNTVSWNLELSWTNIPLHGTLEQVRDQLSNTELTPNQIEEFLRNGSIEIMWTEVKVYTIFNIKEVLKIPTNEQIGIIRATVNNLVMNLNSLNQGKKEQNPLNNPNISKYLNPWILDTK